MKRLIIFLVICLLLTGTVFAYRMAKPVKVTKFDAMGLIALNRVLENLWFLTNGKYQLDIVTSVPAWTPQSEGEAVLYHSGANRRIYFYFDGAWRYINMDG